MRLLKLSGMVCITGVLVYTGCGDDAADGSGGSSSSSSSGGGEGGSTSSSTSSTSSGGGQGGSGGAPIDACEAGTDNCDVNATCIGFSDGFRCECHPGYTSTDAGVTCNDVDECATNTDNCAAVAACTNTVGGFTCACPEEGYEEVNGGRQCVDIDECAANTDNCDAAAACTNTAGSFACTCPPATSDVNGNGTDCQPLLGENCEADAIDISPSSLPIVFSGDTTGASADLGYTAGACPGDAAGAGATSGDRVYRLTPTVTGDYVVNLTTTGYDGSVYVMTDCGDVAQSCVGARNTACSDCTEAMTVSLTSGTTYFIVVDGSSDTENNAGAYRLEIIPPKSALTPIQFDVGAVLLQDGILNLGPGGFDPMDDALDNTGHRLITQSAAATISPANGNGLPDDAFFPANAEHPDVRLHWRYLDNGTNCRLLNTREDSFTFPIPLTTYTEVQVYGLSSEGSTDVDFVLMYDDGTSDTRRVSFGDWFNGGGPAPAGQFFLIDNMDRSDDRNGIQDANDPAIAGVSLAPDATKRLSSIVVTHRGNGVDGAPGNGWFTFFGATGY